MYRNQSLSRRNGALWINTRDLLGSASMFFLTLSFLTLILIRFNLFVLDNINRTVKLNACVINLGRLLVLAFGRDLDVQIREYSVTV